MSIPTQPKTALGAHEPSWRVANRQLLDEIELISEQLFSRFTNSKPSYLVILRPNSPRRSARHFEKNRVSMGARDPITHPSFFFSIVLKSISPSRRDWCKIKWAGVLWNEYLSYSGYIHTLW